MRKALLFAGAFAFALSVQAQTTVYSEDFESYNAGEGIAAQADGWYDWNSSGVSDGTISADYASSGAQSVLVSQADGSDVVYDLGGYTSGKYDVMFKMYIPSGQEAYFNLMHNWDYTATNMYEWAVDCYFAAGEMTWTTGGTDGGAGSFNHDEWFDIQVTADMDNDMGYVYLNGMMMTSWQWSLNNANGSAGMNQLKAVDFFGWGPNAGAGNVVGLYYIDDFMVIESTGVNVEEQSNEVNVAVYPNPANTSTRIDIDGITNAQVNVYSIDGRVVASMPFQSSNGVLTLPVAALTEGIYFVEVNNGAQKITQRLVVRH